MPFRQDATIRHRVRVPADQPVRQPGLNCFLHRVHPLLSRKTIGLIAPQPRRFPLASVFVRALT